VEAEDKKGVMEQKEEKAAADGDEDEDAGNAKMEVDAREGSEAKHDAADLEEAGPAEEKEDEEDDEEDEDEGEDVAPEVPAVDIFTVKDVCDIGEGEPLFANFMFEDWALMSLRFELFLLLKAFKRDMNDPDREGIPEAHLTFYYGRYFRKQLNTRFFGTATVPDLIGLVKDTVKLGESGSVVTARLSEDTDPVSDIFVKLTEESRRDRQRRIDAGDETAKLKFCVVSTVQPPPQPPPPYEPKAQGPRVIMGSSAPRSYGHPWGQQGGQPGWQRPAYGHSQQPFRGTRVAARWPAQSYAPKQQGWR